jgi:hypothetical protein
MFRWGVSVGVGVFVIAVTTALSLLMYDSVEAQSSDFSLQVTPSPLITTLKPGTETTLELKIRNAGTGTELLKIEPRKFTVDKGTGEVDLSDTEPSEIAPWIRFAAPQFEIKPGQWYTQKVRIALPKDTGFSYSLALVISRVNNPDPKTVQGRVIKGSLAVFTLINVDRPGAERKLEITDFESDQGIYEYLPSNFSVAFRNTGNTIIQPAGNIFIQRGSDDSSPIATLPVNDKGGYLLSGTPRTMNAVWDDGFPVFQKSNNDGNESQQLIWDWDRVSHFRIGQYTAKLVAIYNDGQRDVPIVREVTFWVFPWRTILIVSVILGALVYLRHKQIQRRTRKAVRRALEERDKTKGSEHAK